MKLKKINVLFECNSCRDYAFAKLFSKSKLLNKLYLFGKNKMAGKYGVYINLNPNELLNFPLNNKIDLFICFNECNSLAGFINYYKYNLKIPSIGVTKNWFYLEASKLFAKKFMILNNINTPDYIELHNLTEIETAIKKFAFPLVLKFDSLAGGFGSYIVYNKKEATQVIKNLYIKTERDFIKYKPNEKFDGKLNVIAEEFIKGEEYSLLSLWDGNMLLPFKLIKDYKNALDYNKGQNTGGMGGYMPVMLQKRQKDMLYDYINKFSGLLKKVHPNFTGFITSGLMFSKDKLYILEYNMRPADTEGQILSSHLNNDFLSLLYRTAIGRLGNVNIRYKKGITGCVCVTNPSYINRHYDFEEETNEKIKSTVKLNNRNLGIDLFFGGSCQYDEVTNTIFSAEPERLINLCATYENPFRELYEQLANFESENIYFRKDIGQ